MDRIPVAGPWITQKEIDYVTDAVTNAWYTRANMYHERFEEAFAQYCGRKYAISLPSCTSALHLAFACLDLKPGDEVVVPDITWIASVAPINYVGATPVFADIDPDSWCISVDSIRENITERTKAILIVNLYGNVPDIDAILELARRRNLSVIEDAAESVGTEYKGRRTGGFGLVSAFSFHGSKTLTTGEGGMLLRDDDNIYRRSLFLRDHGREPGGKPFWNTEVGFKYKMSSLQAALGLAQLERIDELIERKLEMFTWYVEELRDVRGIKLNYQAPGVKNTYWMVTVVLDPSLGLGKEDVMHELSERGIDGRPIFYPLSSMPVYASTAQAARARAQNLHAYAIAPYGINLPSSLSLTRQQVAYVSDQLRDIILRAKSATASLHCMVRTGEE